MIPNFISRKDIFKWTVSDFGLSGRENGKWEMDCCCCFYISHKLRVQNIEKL